jgi:hypothetical protein
MVWARVLADLVVVFHAAYVGFVGLGLGATLVGLARRKDWARNFWFRTIHLAMILVVVLESLAGIVCPLTTWENVLRRRAGQDPYPLDFIGYWVHRILFYQAPAWVFVMAYTAFGLAVAATFLLAPPRWPRRRTLDR